jgi:hypothetical protein
MFARWSQENFFRYMRQSYNLDGLVDYGTDISAVRFSEGEFVKERCNIRVSWVFFLVST